jgi:hypothetical protein
MNFSFSYSKFFCLWALIISCQVNAVFLPRVDGLKQYNHRQDVLLLASPGRSGSTLLTNTLKTQASNYTVLKTHMLPPPRRFKGKSIFIFSNPDKSAESALYRTLHSALFGRRHFFHLETADADWFKQIGEDSTKQTLKYNLLAYDALGVHEQLVEWIENKTKCELQDARILAIKYEDLWNPSVIQAIKNFLKIDNFNLPTYEPRGKTYLNKLKPKERKFRKAYNLGTVEQPHYKAYDKARAIWEKAPAFQYLK